MAAAARLGSRSCDAAGRELLPFVLLRVLGVAIAAQGVAEDGAASFVGGCDGKNRRKKVAVDLGCVRVRLRRGAAAVGPAEQRRNCSCCSLVLFLEAC